MYKLYFSKEKENIHDDQDNIINIPHFTILDSFIRNYIKLIGFLNFQQNPIYSVFDAVTDEFNLKLPKQNKIIQTHDKAFSPTLFNYWEPLLRNLSINDWDAYWFNFELSSLFIAVHQWLRPKEKYRQKKKKENMDDKEYRKEYFKPKDIFLKKSIQLPEISIDNSWVKYLEKTGAPPLDGLKFYDMNDIKTPDDFYSIFNYCQQFSDWPKMLLKQYLESVFRHRLNQVGRDMKIEENEDEKKILFLYSAESLLPLAWAEIMGAIEKGVYARYCSFCGRVFRITTGYSRDILVCSNEKCQDMYEKIRYPQGITEYNRIKKQESRANSKDPNYKIDKAIAKADREKKAKAKKTKSKANPNTIKKKT